MTRRPFEHWPFFITGPVLALLLIVFWSLDQGVWSAGRTPVTALLESPLVAFGLIGIGAFISAFVAGEFQVRLPLTVEPLVYAFTGGAVMGAGAVLAAMSVHSVALFNLAGIFILTSFMLTKGWVYAVFMALGGYVGSRLFYRLAVRGRMPQRRLVLPPELASQDVQRALFYALTGLLVFFLVAVAVFSVLPAPQKQMFVTVAVLMVVFGIVVERGTICMSSMLKEWFIARTAYVWKNVLAVIMCLALFYQAGLWAGLYEPLRAEPFVQHVGWLAIGSFLMGLGFIFADGCFIGSLWKAGQGHVVNVVGILGMLIGTGIAQALMKNAAPAGAELIQVPGSLNALLPAGAFLAILWLTGTILLLAFRDVKYKY